MLKEFQPPTFQQVKSHFTVLLKADPDNPIEMNSVHGVATKFFEHFSKNNWQVRIAKNKYRAMKNWKAACSTWLRNARKYDTKLFIQMKSKEIFND